MPISSSLETPNSPARSCTRSLIKTYPPVGPTVGPGPRYRESPLRDRGRRSRSPLLPSVRPRLQAGRLRALRSPPPASPEATASPSPDCSAMHPVPPRRERASPFSRRGEPAPHQPARSWLALRVPGDPEAGARLPHPLRPASPERPRRRRRPHPHPRRHRCSRQPCPHRRRAPWRRPMQRAGRRPPRPTRRPWSARRGAP